MEAARSQAPAEANAPTGRATVCVQGLGFVGTAMALAVASARGSEGEPSFDVVGVELDSPEGRQKVEALNAGRLPSRSSDPKMDAALRRAVDAGNFRATTDPAAYESASVVVVDVHLDLQTAGDRPSVDFSGLRAAMRTLGERLPAGALIVVETTVPPGTCEKVVAPELAQALEARGLPGDAILLAHSYERVMPGAEYFDSIVSFWRVYAGHTEAAADACEAFLSQVIDVDTYPLSRLGSTTASETGKVLENSYRATTIAFMEEWGRFAEAVGVDLFEVIGAIRRRPTHSNMRQPGFGVGGYCLPKDPLFPGFAAAELWGMPELEFPFSTQAVATNEVMPLVTVDKVEELLGGMRDRRVLLLGLSYRQGVEDTRFSPSEVFVHNVRGRGADVVCHDPFVTKPGDMVPVEGDLPDPSGFDAIVFAVGHDEYLAMDPLEWLGDARPVIVDANQVLPRERLECLAEAGCTVWAIGRGAIAAPGAS